ncbi:MAG: TetR/AcrR family transcriptional regulator [Bdellovibrionales bacterium]
MTQKQKIDFEKRREMILDTVSPLFAEKGCSVTTKELAAAAGISEALIYKHFKSKSELFEAVKTRCCKNVHPVAERLLQKAEAKERLPLSIVLLAHAVHVGFEEDLLPKKEMHKLVLQSLAAKGDFAVETFSNFGKWICPISEDMTEGQREGWLKKTPFSNEELLWMVHHFIVGMAFTLMPEKKMEVFDVDAVEIVEKCSLQGLVMLGMDIEEAAVESKKALKEFKNL